MVRREYGGGGGVGMVIEECRVGWGGGVLVEYASWVHLIPGICL